MLINGIRMKEIYKCIGKFCNSLKYEFIINE